MKGNPTSAGSASRRENEFRAGRGTGRHERVFDPDPDPDPDPDACGEDVGGEMGRGGFQAGGSSGIPDRRRHLSLAASRLCGLSASCSEALSGDGEAIGCWCSWTKGFCRPGWGWVFMGEPNPALTRWAIVCRPSGPGAGGWARVAWIGFVSLVSFVVRQRWRVEPRSSQRARTERETGLGADRMTEV